MKVAGQSPHSSASSVQASNSKDAVQRKKDFIRRRRHQADQDSASKVIQGMSKIARDGHNSMNENAELPGTKPTIGWKVCFFLKHC